MVFHKPNHIQNAVSPKALWQDCVLSRVQRCPLRRAIGNDQFNSTRTLSL